MKEITTEDKIPFTWGPQIAYMKNLENRLDVLEQIVIGKGKWIRIKMEDGKVHRVRLTRKKVEVNIATD